jgi:phage tail sheath protein FI
MVMNYFTPGVYIEEVPSGARPIQSVGTTTAGFVGVAPNAGAYVNIPRVCNNWEDFTRDFITVGNLNTNLSHAVRGFFRNGGGRCFVVNVGEDGAITGGPGRIGIDVFEEIDEIAMVAAPGYTDAASYEAILGHCERLRDRVAILDVPEDISDFSALQNVATASARRASRAAASEGDASASGTPAPPGVPGVRPRQSDSGFGTVYFPWIQVADYLAPRTTGTNGNQQQGPPQVYVPPSGHIAGVWARTDTRRGVHKAPANEVIVEATGLRYYLTRQEQDQLNPIGVNCIRYFGREGIRVWGARTLAAGSSEWRYLNVRRLCNMIEESIEESTRWTVFEPNDLTLWRNIRRDVGAYLTRVWRDGALFGAKPEEAFFVKCDAETNPPEVIDAGMVIVLIGIAPVKPAEFVVFRISQSERGAEIEAVGGSNA